MKFVREGIGKSRRGGGVSAVVGGKGIRCHYLQGKIPLKEGGKGIACDDSTALTLTHNQSFAPPVRIDSEVCGGGAGGRGVQEDANSMRVYGGNETDESEDQQQRLRRVSILTRN